jgi:asparagine synthase (glutamine-hydrolysing)
VCGILVTSEPGVDGEKFSGALASLGHRGPDATGYLECNGFKLGHRRLKILDVDDRSNQPFRSATGRHVIVFNGEIYNYRELARKHGLQLRTSSDTEVLVELYAKLGAAMLKDLNGMFAFVVIDTLSGELFAARDRLGVKPLYFCRDGAQVSFSSEVEALLLMTNDCAIDDIGLRQYLKLRTFFNGRTLYKGVEMFPAGCFMESGRIVRYWELPSAEQEPPGDEELRELVRSAVSARLLADVPVGSFLSGGLDSTIVSALANRPHTWTAGFSDCNEFAWGRMAAAAQHGVHHEVLIDREEFLGTAHRMIAKRRLPLSVPNEVLIAKMSEAAKKTVTVLLSGEGADELFFGYDRIFRWAAAAKTFDLAAFDRLYSYGSHRDDDVLADVLSSFMREGATALEIVASFFQVAHLHGLLVRLDYATMLHAVEARVPFVDFRLVERLAGVSMAWKMPGGAVKEPLKRVFRAAVPRPILERQKVGFPVPLGDIYCDRPAGQAPMDAWLHFNLRCLGIEQGTIDEVMT